MPQPVHLDLELIELAGSAEVCIFGSISLKELLSQHIHLVFGPRGPLICQVSIIFSSLTLALRNLYELLVASAFLCSLKLQAASMLLKVALDPISFIS